MEPMLLAGGILLSLAAVPQPHHLCLIGIQLKTLNALDNDFSGAVCECLDVLWDISVGKPCFKPCMSSANR